MSNRTLHIVDGVKLNTARWSLKMEIEAFAKIEACHMGNRDNPKLQPPWVKFQTREGAEKALEAMNSGKIYVNGYALRAEWRNEKAPPPPTGDGNTKKELDMSSRDLFLMAMKKRNNVSSSSSESSDRPRGRGRGRDRGRGREDDRGRGRERDYRGGGGGGGRDRRAPALRDDSRSRGPQQHRGRGGAQYAPPQDNRGGYAQADPASTVRDVTMADVAGIPRDPWGGRVGQYSQVAPPTARPASSAPDMPSTGSCGHQFEFVSGVGHECDFCGAEWNGSFPMACCRVCNYEMCKKCVENSLRDPLD